MKKLFNFALIAVVVLFCSCGGIGGGNLPTKVDYQMLSNDAELEKVYGVVLEKLGDNIQFVDEVRLAIFRPSKEGSIIRTGKPDEFHLGITHLYQADKKKLYQMSYTNESGWYSVGERKVEIFGSANVETFRLEDEMFDMSPLTTEILCKIVKDALAKYKDETKYSYQYVKSIGIQYGRVEVTIYGRLSANDLEKNNYYKADLNGMPIR